MQKNQLTIFSICIIFLLTLGGAYWVSSQKTISQKKQILVEKIFQLKSIANIDSEYSKNMDKILSVINRFNPGMSKDVKQTVAREIIFACEKYENIDIELICATITHESAFSWNPQIVSPVGALGLMQIMPSTGKFLANIEGIEWTYASEILFNPIYNVRLGTRYLSSLIELYEIDGGLAAYNGGGTRAAMWLAQNRADGVLYKETQNYVPAVLGLYDELRNSSEIN